MHFIRVLPIASLALLAALFAASSAQSAAPTAARAPSTATEKGAGEPSKKSDSNATSAAKSVTRSVESSTRRDTPGGKKGGVADAEGAKTAPAAGSKSAPSWARKTAEPGVVRLVRGGEKLEIRVLDRHQRLVPATVPHFSRFLRSRGGFDHAIDARLVGLVGKVSDHFGGREVMVVSGFRPYSPKQFARHSNHNEGRAIDFAVRGIANETVRDFCRTLPNVGVGYYPNSSFVHLDVRDTNAYWVDYASAGQAPRYHAPDSRSADEEEEMEGATSPDASAAPKGGGAGGALRDLASGENPPAVAVPRREAAGEHSVFLPR